MIQTIEALHAVQEGIIEDTAMADLASVLGWSYPACRGGVMTYLDRMGRQDFERVRVRLQEKFGQQICDAGIVHRLVSKRPMLLTSNAFGRARMLLYERFSFEKVATPSYIVGGSSMIQRDYLIVGGGVGEPASATHCANMTPKAQ